MKSLKTMISDEFNKEYKKEIRTMAKEKDVDLGVARDMLVAHVRNKVRGITVSPERQYNFTGCEKLDLKKAAADIKVLEDNFIIPKVL